MANKGGEKPGANLQLIFYTIYTLATLFFRDVVEMEVFQASQGRSWMMLYIK
jgi:hypothetical protein